MNNHASQSPDSNVKCTAIIKELLKLASCINSVYRLTDLIVLLMFYSHPSEIKSYSKVSFKERGREMSFVEPHPAAVSVF